jgi:hypothetical protein
VSTPQYKILAQFFERPSAGICRACEFPAAGNSGGGFFQSLEVMAAGSQALPRQDFNAKKTCE